MSKLMRILTLAMIVVTLAVGTQIGFAAEDDVNYPRSIIIPVVTE